MKVKTFETEQDWLDARRGKITGTRLKDLIVKRGTGKKKGYYELIAERIAIPASEEPAIDRGKRLEEEAIEHFAEIAGKKVNNDLVMWHRDDEERIAVSPDGYTDDLKEAVEVKCLSSASHVEAWLTQEIPSEYESQVLQYFIVNDELERLFFVFYDPRCTKDIFWIIKERAQLQEQVDEYLLLEKMVLAEIEEIETRLTF